jgi:hypothetical protein
MSYIKSPQTGKPIKINGFAHKKLIKEGYFQDASAKKDITKKEIIPSPQNDDTHELVKQTSRNAMNVMRKIKAGQIELPADMDSDEQISNYIQQCLLLEMIQKPAKPAKKKRMKAPPVSSSESESETE